MKRTTRLLICGVLLAGMMPQITSAVLFTNKVKNIQARNVRVNLSSTGVSSGETYSFVNGAIRNQFLNPALGGNTGKAWVQFDLSSAWALYGQANLTNATLTLWNQNGISRRFWVAGIADGAGLEGWDQSTLTWSNAPANDYFNLATMGYGWDNSKIFGGTNIWDNLGTGGVFVTTPSNTQGAYYVSTNGTSRVFQFLQSDTDGKVTCSISDGPFNSNQTIPIGTNGVYDGEQLAADGSGIPTRDSPTLTLVFDVRVALVGGGFYCSGPGLDISLAGSDVGVDYLLYKDAVYTGQTVAGNGSAVSFGLQTAQGTYTAIASNTTTTATSAVLGDPIILVAPTAPSITVQPVSFVGATNSIAVFSLTGAGDIASYAWYRNGVALTNGGRYSGVTTSQLIISPVLASDAATTANGYYAVLINACGAQAISTTNALTIQVARDLVWQGTPSNSWDIATTANWTNSAGAAVTFLQGDNVLLDDTALDLTVAPASPYLSPGNITFNHSAEMTINGPGKISGPGSKLIVNGTTLSSKLVVSSANDIRGGVVINDGWLKLNVFNALGDALNTNMITMSGAGGFSLLEVNTATAWGGIINVLQNSTLSLPVVGGNQMQFNGSLIGTAGKTLTIQAPGAIAGNNTRFYGNFTCDLDLVLNLNGANLAPYQSGTTIYNGVISGNGILYPRGGTTILNGANTFNYTLISQGHVGVGIDSSLPSYSPLGLGTFTQDNQGDNGILAWGGARTIENPFTWLYRDNANRSFTTLGTNQLTMSGAFDLSGGTNNVVRTFNIGNTAPTILSGVIGDAGQNMGINKTGNGVLYLDNAANTYTGPTTNSAGRLAGSGTIAGSLVVATNAVLGGGSAAAIGTLTVNGNVTLNAGGNVYARINRSGLQSDMVSVGGTLTKVGTGTVTVTNLGAALQAGDKFTLFNKPLVAGNTMTIAGPGVIWTNKLAVDGSIEVLNVIPTYPTNITTSVSGNTLTVSWPATHLGWSLQAQTNTLSVGLANNWATIPGTASVTSTNIAINPANPTVFYRLFYLTP